MAKEEITRSKFAALPARDQVKIVRSHEIVNDPPKPFHELQDGEVYRSDFDRRSVFEKHAILKRGLKIVDDM